MIVPDLRGAGWSDAPAGPYRKSEMARDLADVLDALEVGAVRVVAHDRGGPVAFCLLLEHPGRVEAFLGLNTLAPWLVGDRALLRHGWRFWHQLPMLAPWLGPRLLRSPDSRFLGFVARWLGGGWSWSAEEGEVYLKRHCQPARALAGSQWYRTFQREEALAWMRGK